MKNQTGSGIILLILVVGAFIVGALWYNQKNKSNTDTNQKTGQLYIGVTDATTDIENVDTIDLSIKKVELHSKTEGWVTASNRSKTYDLLALHANGKIELHAKEKIKADTYDRVRVTIGEAKVKTKTKGTMKAYLPGTQIVLNMNVVVRENADTHLKLDVLADKSIHATSDGKYVFAAVVNAEARSNAHVTVAIDDSITINEGSTDSNTTVGLDIDGTSKTNFILDANSVITIDASTYGNARLMLGGKTYSDDGKDKDTAEPAPGLDTKVDIDTSVDASTDINTNTDIKTKTNGVLDSNVR